MTLHSGPELTVTWRWVRPLLWGTYTALWTSAITMIVLSLTAPPGQVAPGLMPTLWRWLIIAAVPAAMLLLLEGRGTRPGSGRRVTMLLATALPLPHLFSVTSQARTTPLADDIPILLTAPDAPVWLTLATGCLTASCFVLALLSLLHERDWAPVPPRPSAMRVVAAVLCGVTIVGYGVVQTHDLLRQEFTTARSTTSPAPDTLPPMTPIHDPSRLTGKPAWVFRSPDLAAPVEVHLGARGPVVADEDTVVGLDGATGRQLWSFERNEGHLARLRLRAGAPERVMVSPDGRSVIVITCLKPDDEWKERPAEESIPMLTVIDAVTGNPRFTVGTTGVGAIPQLSCSGPDISMTDHVMVIESHGYDLITGTERWRLPEKLFLLEGPQGSSHVVALRSDDGLPDGGSETLKERGMACPMCIDNTVDILSDEDLSATHQLDAIGYLAFGGLLMRGWLLTHEDSTRTNAWLNVDTLQRIPITSPVQSHGEEHFWRAPDTAMLRAQADQKLPDGSKRPIYHVLDPWTGETGIVTTPYEDSTFGPLGVGLWFDVAKHGRRFQVWGSDGSAVGERIELAMPAGEPWELQGFLRSHHGLVVAFSWEPRHDLVSNVSVAMYR